MTEHLNTKLIVRDTLEALEELQTADHTDQREVAQRKYDAIHEMKTIVEEYPMIIPILLTRVKAYLLMRESQTFQNLELL